MLFSHDLKLRTVAHPKVSGHPFMHHRREHQSATLLQHFRPPDLDALAI